MRRHRQPIPNPRLLPLFLVWAVVAAACGGDGEAAVDSQALLLAECPDPLIIQTDWFPEPEHGAVYNLVGEGGRFDPETGSFRGPLAADRSVTIEIRSGGPFIGDRSTIEVLASDPDIFLGFVNTDEAVAEYIAHPSTAVVAPLEINPQIIMWDPDRYQIESWRDVKSTEAVVSHFAGASYPEYLVAAGLVTEGQLEGNYTGSPRRFIESNGAIIQQGFATQEPYLYENTLTDWGRPVDYLLIHDSGFEVYQGSLTILDDRLDQAARFCLSALVPLVQQSVVDFQQDPTATNDVILDAVGMLGDRWTLSESGAMESVIQMGALGIVGNGPDNTVGNFDTDRVNEVIIQIRDELPSIAGPPGLSADDLVTNEFIDPDIGL